MIRDLARKILYIRCKYTRIMKIYLYIQKDYAKIQSEW